jgi:DNA-binding MarR family transcriptional regulator
MGLINQAPDKNLRSILINLTPKGQTVAQKIIDLDAAIKGI